MAEEAAASAVSTTFLLLVDDVHDGIVVFVAGTSLEALRRLVLTQVHSLLMNHAQLFGYLLHLYMIAFEEGMQQSTLHVDTLRRLHLHHACEEVESVRVVSKVPAEFHEVLVAVDGPARERHLELGQVLFAALPGLLFWGAETLKYLEDLADLGLTVEERAAMSQLIKNAADGPDVNSGRVRLAAEQNLGRAIPQRHYLMSVTLERKPEGASQSKVGHLDLILALVDQNIARFKISMHYSSLMTVQQRLQNLPHNCSHRFLVKRSTSLIQILLDVEVEVLEDKVQLVASVHYINQVDYSRVLQLAQYRDFADGSAGKALLAALYLDLFQSHLL